MGNVNGTGLVPVDTRKTAFKALRECFFRSYKREVSPNLRYGRCLPTLPPQPPGTTAGGVSPPQTLPPIDMPKPQPPAGNPPGMPDPAGAPPLEKDLVYLAAMRFSYGPAAGELDQITRMGFDVWLSQQLYPSQINDSLLESRLQSIPSLRQTSAQLMDSATLKAQKRSLVAELFSATLLRAVLSRRQLLQVMTEFWSDHFNVDIGKDGVLPLKFADDKGIRTHALGRFRDLLGHSAHSPAMLQYLDNRLNRGKHPNENYAREILELHTLGVKGGYTEQDVKEVARCFTGWTINPANGEFMFDASIHDNGSKIVLGRTIPPGGQQEAETVLDILAYHPSTAQFIADKLCRKFISDNPSPTVVTNIAAKFMANQGNIPETIRAIAMQSEFGTSFSQKFRRPWDFAVSSLRALGAAMDNPLAVSSSILAMDQFPFSWGPPTGYPDNMAAWLNASGLLARWNLAQYLARGISADLQGLISGANTAQGIVARLEQRLLGRPLTTQTSNAILALLSGGKPVTQPLDATAIKTLLPVAVGAVLSSPEFQVK